MPCLFSGKTMLIPEDRAESDKVVHLLDPLVQLIKSHNAPLTKSTCIFLVIRGSLSWSSLKTFIYDAVKVHLLCLSLFLVGGKGAYKKKQFESFNCAKFISMFCIVHYVPVLTNTLHTNNTDKQY